MRLHKLEMKLSDMGSILIEIFDAKVLQDLPPRYINQGNTVLKVNIYHLKY